MKTNDELKKEAREKQWEDRAEIAKNKAKLEGHKAQETVSEWNDDMKQDWKHAKNVADEKATEAKHSMEEAGQKAKNRLDEKFGK